MLKTRLITAVILLCAAISGVLLLPTMPFAILSGVLFLAGAWEWTALAGFTSVPTRVGAFCAMPFIIIVLMVVLVQAFGSRAIKEDAFIVAVPILGFWVSALIILLRYPKDIAWCKNKIAGVIIGSMVLAPSWAMLAALQHESPMLVLYVLGLVSLADSGAYFAGKQFGKYKLLPQVSPGKTWEGVVGGLAAALVWMACSFSMLNPKMSFASWVVLGVVTVLFSMVGDLFESFFKRMRNVKDSGRLLPGHGGVLDRIDSLTAAVPIFTIGFMFFI